MQGHQTAKNSTSRYILAIPISRRWGKRGIKMKIKTVRQTRFRAQPLARIFLLMTKTGNG